MADKYEVVRPWHGVAKGEVIEREFIHPALASHVRKLSPQAAAVLTPAVAAPAPSRKDEIKAQLTALGIEFDGRKSADELAALLPAGE